MLSYSRNPHLASDARRRTPQLQLVCSMIGRGFVSFSLWYPEKRYLPDAVENGDHLRSKRMNLKIRLGSRSVGNKEPLTQPSKGWQLNIGDTKHEYLSTSSRYITTRNAGSEPTNSNFEAMNWAQLTNCGARRL